MQRMGFVIIGFALVLNIRCGAHSAHYGWGIIGGLTGDDGFLAPSFLAYSAGRQRIWKTFLELHFYTWAYVGYVCLLAGLAILFDVA